MSKPTPPIDDTNELDKILELVFWHGQGNQYPEQNRQPGTSVAEAKQQILALLAHITAKARLEEAILARRQFTEAVADSDFIVANGERIATLKAQAQKGEVKS